MITWPKYYDYKPGSHRERNWIRNRRKEFTFKVTVIAGWILLPIVGNFVASWYYGYDFIRFLSYIS